tara:strand:+ start:61 stop:501 length:441 start_codon:yes stop_codon:yes gene_type:complete
MTRRWSAVVTVTNLAGGSGSTFGIINGNGASCYIPVQLARAAHLEAGDVVPAVVIINPNPFAVERTPYMIIHANAISWDDRAARSAAAMTEVTDISSEVEAEVWSYMLDNREATVPEIVANTPADIDQVQAMLRRIGTPEHIWRGN